MSANRDITKLTPQFQVKVNAFLEEVWDTVFITEGWRSQERQQELYNQGRTTPWQIVTWTLDSDHTKGIAIDIAFNGSELYPSDINRWKEIAEIAKKYWMLWGYQEWWIDLPHFWDDGVPYKDELPQYFMDNYRRIPVVTSDNMCANNSRGCVFEGFEKIFITPYFFELDEFARELALEHEFCHIIFNRCTRTEQEYWRKISEFESDMVAYVESITGEKYTENGFLTKYAKTNYKEDFWETWKVIYARKIRRLTIEDQWWVNVKKDYFTHLYNKYS